MSSPTVEDLVACKAALLELIDNTNCAPILIRLAWHDSGTYDAAAGTGGANGSIRFVPEINHGANAGLVKALGLLEPIKQRFPTVGWADLMQMGSACAVEACGGPKINFRYGRVSAEGPEACPAEGNLPAGNSPFPGGDTPGGHLRKVFYRMGFNDREIVALSGAHTLGRAHKDRSGAGAEMTSYTSPSACPRHDGKPGIGATEGGSAWTVKWLTFDNSYYQTLLAATVDPELLRLETDSVLVTDEAFRPIVEEYAANQDVFFADFSNVLIKLSELGSVFEPPEGIRIP